MHVAMYKHMYECCDCVCAPSNQAYSMLRCNPAQHTRHCRRRRRCDALKLITKWLSGWP